MRIGRMIGSAALLLMGGLAAAHAKDVRLSSFIADEAHAVADGSNPLSEAEANLDAAWDKLPLKVQRALFVSEKVPLYGAYTARPNATFKPGETLRTYIEPIGYRYEAAADGFQRFGIALDYEILDADGTVATGKRNFMTFESGSRAKLKELMLNASLDLDGAPAGNYVLHYTLHDVKSAKTAEVALPFTIAE